jgi:hypothetical protein
MEINIEHGLGNEKYSRIVTPDTVCIYFKRHHGHVFHISTEFEITDGNSGSGWYFREKDLRQSAELFLRLADELAEEEDKGQ